MFRSETIPPRCPHCGAQSLIRDRDIDAWSRRNLVLVCILCARRVLVGPERAVREGDVLDVQPLLPL